MMSQGTVMTETKQRIAEEDVMRIIGEPTLEDIEQLEIKCVEIVVKFDHSFMEEMSWDTCA